MSKSSHLGSAGLRGLPRPTTNPSYRGTKRLIHFNEVMMLSLLSTFEAATVLYCWAELKDWQLAFTPDVLKSVSKQKVQCRVSMYKTFIINAILVDELPALKKSKGKPANKKLLDKLDIPSEFLDDLAQYDYWITMEDLLVFMERSPFISKDYSHGRDALARLLCAMTDKSELSKNNQQSLIEHLEHKIESVEAELNTKLQLSENTLKGCCREILDTYSSINNGKPEK